MSAYDNLGWLLDGKPIAKLRTGAGYSSAHVIDVPEEGQRLVRVRGNLVVVAWADGRVRLDSCGYHTLTTSAAMRMACPGVSSVRGRYMLGSRPFECANGRETLELEAVDA